MATDTPIVLLGRCINDDCERNDPESERYQQSWEIPARVDEMVQYGDGPFARTPVTATQYTVPLSDDGLFCPDCQQPASVTEGEAVKYPKMIR